MAAWGQRVRLSAQMVVEHRAYWSTHLLREAPGPVRIVMMASLTTSLHRLGNDPVPEDCPTPGGLSGW
jgi:hypothetical protein